MAGKALDNCVRQICRLAELRAARGLGDRQLLERFVADNDEAAFVVLVERHAPVVLGVCRRGLGSIQDAEDACQATFMVLARRAATIRKTTSLACWLHGVAARVAAHLRREGARRSRREQQRHTPAVPDPATEASWREVQAALDEELARLPERLRAPLVLYYLEGQTREAAARQLGLTAACLHGRLERGRKALCKALTRRGVTLATAFLGAAVGEGAARGALAPTTVLRTARAAVQQAAGRSLDKCLISSRVLTLAQEVSRNMLWTNVKLHVSALLGAGLLVAALGGSLAALGAGPEEKAPPAADPPRYAGQPSKTPTGLPAIPAKADGTTAGGHRPIPVSGRVLGPGDKPVAGARVYMLHWAPPPGQPPLDLTARPRPLAETDRDGRFSFAAAWPDLGELFVTAPGYGPGWVIKPHMLQQTWPIEPNQVVRLARDDVPVRGRLLDLQGQPVAGATVRVFALKASPTGTLDAWIAAVKKRRIGENVQEHEYLSTYQVDGLAHFFPPVTTDRDGRFRLRGIGRERVVAFNIEGPTIETTVLHAVTRPGLGVGELRVAEAAIFYGGGTVKELRLKPYYPPTFTHTADPCLVVHGVVRDKATGRPLAGAVVRNTNPLRYPVFYNSAVTDKDGRFRLTGLPRANPYGGGASVVAFPPQGQPYLSPVKTLPPDKERKDVAVDFDLPPGVWLEGQVKDKATGRGVPAQLNYVVLGDTLARDLAAPILAPPGVGASGPYYRNPFGEHTDPQGKFRIVVARERGVLGVRADGPQADRYRVGVGADRIRGLPKDKPGEPVPQPVELSVTTFNTLIEVSPARDAKSVHHDVLLDPGRVVTVQLRGPDGKPLAGARAYGQSAPSSYTLWSQAPLPAEFTVYGLEPGQGRTLLLDHPGKNLAARCEIKADERGPVVVTLRPAGTVVGRLLDADGLPLAHAAVTLSLRLPGDSPFQSRPHSRPEYRTDARGRFRIEGLVPGVAYRGLVRLGPVYVQSVFDDVSVNGGERKDLGDIKVKRGDSQ